MAKVDVSEKKHTPCKIFFEIFIFHKGLIFLISYAMVLLLGSEIQNERKLIVDHNEIKRKDIHYKDKGRKKETKHSYQDNKKRCFTF